MCVIKHSKPLHKIIYLCRQREAFNSVSFDIIPAFHSNPDNAYVQEFIKRKGNNEEDATLIRRLSSLSISVDSTPAFLSLTSEDLHNTISTSRVQPVANGMDLYGRPRVQMDPIASPVETTYTSDSSQSVPPQCTPPSRANNSLLVFQRTSGLPAANGGQFLIPARNQLCCAPQCPQDHSKYVYPSLNPTPHLLSDVRCDGFPSREKLRLVPACTIIYSNPVSYVCITVQYKCVKCM